MPKLRHLTTYIGPWLVKRPRLMRLALRTYATRKGVEVEFLADQISIRKGLDVILLRADMAAYVRDFVDDFESYANAVVVEPQRDGSRVLDFSNSADFKLRGWDHFQVRLPGVPEPIETVEQYLRLTGMNLGMHVIDLGAYAGISSLVFQEVVGVTGRVVALEADPKNAACARLNFDRYRQIGGQPPELLEAAVWSDSGTIAFFAESSLGSAAAQVLTRGVSEPIEVRAVTLSEIVEGHQLNRIDVIKADIEGAEFAAFSDSKFFEKYRPVIIFEPAMNGIAETGIESLTQLLAGYGYTVSAHDQAGSRLPLLLCKPVSHPKL